MDKFKSSDINFSDSAINHFSKVLKKRGYGEGIRLGVKEAGCSGYEYTFDFVDNFDEEHILIETSACNVFIDSKMILLMSIVIFLQMFLIMRSL